MLPEPVRIRPAALTDIPTITAIYAREVSDGLATWEETPPDETDMADRMRKIFAAGLPYLVAERDGLVCGYAYAGPFHPRSGYRYTVEDTVYVAPSAQGAGIGTALLGDIVARCETLGYRQMMALIHWTQDSASVALHRRLGFNLVGIAPAVGFKLGGWRDLAYMQRALGPGATTLPPSGDSDTSNRA